MVGFCLVVKLTLGGFVITEASTSSSSRHCLSAGIHIRTYARAFLMEDEQGSRAVFVSCDTAMMGQLVKVTSATRAIQLVLWRWDSILTPVVLG